MDMLVFMGWSSVHTQLPFQIIIPTASGVFSNKFFTSRNRHIEAIFEISKYHIFDQCIDFGGLIEKTSVINVWYLHDQLQVDTLPQLYPALNSQSNKTRTEWKKWRPPNGWKWWPKAEHTHVETSTWNGNIVKKTAGSMVQSQNGPKRLLDPNCQFCKNCPNC